MRRAAYDDCCDQYLAMLGDGEALESDSILGRVTGELLDIVGDPEGREALDAGCGEGYLSRLLARRGATVTAVDISSRLVAAARSRAQAVAVDYRVADLSDPQPDLVGRFDLVISHLVLNDVEDHEGYVRTIAGSLKPGGRVAMSLNSPYSAVRREKAKSYFEPGPPVIYQGLASLGIRVPFYHRTMEEYVAAFCDCGLLLRRLRDIRLDGLPHGESQDRLDVPALMVLELVKPYTTESSV